MNFWLPRCLISFILGSSLLAQEVQQISVSPHGEPARSNVFLRDMSSDARWVLMSTSAPELLDIVAPEDTDQFVLLDRETRLFETVSLDDAGNPADGDISAAVMSDDARFIVFTTTATNLVGRQARSYQLVLRDRALGRTVRILDDIDGDVVDDHVNLGDISDDGRFIVFDTRADDLSVGPGNGELQVMLLDRTTGELTRVSEAPDGEPGDRRSTRVKISRDGTKVAFSSDADNLSSEDTYGTNDGFLYDRLSGEVSLVSRDWLGRPAQTDCSVRCVSGDGRFVGLVTDQVDFVPDKTTLHLDAYIRDLDLGTTTRVGLGPGGVEANDHVRISRFSPDGRFVTLSSEATNLTEDETFGASYSFLLDRTTGERWFPARGVGGVLANANIGTRSSADGQTLTLLTRATNLLPCSDGTIQVYLADRSGQASWSTECDGWPGTEGTPSLALSERPSLCSAPLVQIENSYGLPTLGSALLSGRRMSGPTRWGGTLLVEPWVEIPIGLAPGFNSMPVEIPCDPALHGREIFLQVIQLDPGASRGVSFTRRLRFLIGS